MRDPFQNELARRIWNSRYRWHGDGSLQGSWRRVARALASCEPHDRDEWARRFYRLLEDFKFLPGGRILAGAGTPLPVTLFNCFVGEPPDGTLDNMLRCLDELARTSLAGGGIGIDFSAVPSAAQAPPSPALLRGGPLPLLKLWDALCAAIDSGRVRHGAMMATLDCTHPDLFDFIAAKAGPGDLPRFMLSVMVSDDFLRASRLGGPWPPVPPSPLDNADAQRRSATDLWQAIIGRNRMRSEPGLLFADTLRRMNPLAYAETISAVNPCSEVPLPAHGACDLGSFNLTRFVHHPFDPRARFDLAELLACVPSAVRLLDNVYEISAFPTPRHAEVSRHSRRIGLGITGLADALAMLGLRYDSEPARRFARDLMRSLCVEAYRASVRLAQEKGAFPAFHGGEHVRGEFVSALPSALRADIAAHGLRNSHLLAIAPAGSISLLANGVSSGLEPLPPPRTQRRVRLEPHCVESMEIECHSVALYRRLHGAEAPLPAVFADAGNIAPDAQLEMQAALQRHVDNAISKTVSVPEDFPPARYDALFRYAHALGLKGCSTYRPESLAGAVVTPAVNV